MSIEKLYAVHFKHVLQRYHTVLEESSYDKIIIHSGMPRSAFLDDNDYPYRVNPHFKYFVPLKSNPHCFIIISDTNKPQLIYYQQEDYWFSPPASPNGFWIDHYDIKIVNSLDKVKAALPANLSNAAYIGEDAERLKWGFKHINPPQLMNPLHYTRAYKTEYEIESMRQANLVAIKGHKAAKEAFLAGSSEFHIHLAYLQATENLEEEVPYKNIIAYNHHSSILHYHGLSPKIYDEQHRHSLVIDAGADVHGYASDITRTFSYRDNEFNALIAAMDQQQLGLLDEIEIGKSYQDLHYSMHRRIATLLTDFDFVGLDVDTIVETGISNTFFPHGIGHYIGLQVHDIGGFLKNPQGDGYSRNPKSQFLRLYRDIELDNVFTIEPGLYFIDLLLNRLKETEHSKYLNWGKIDQFRQYGGVRIEDDVVVRDNGIENLTRDAIDKLGGL